MTATNAFGRQVIDYLTNKSGGGVIAGDVVVIDTTNDQAFTTTTSAGFTGGVGVAQETIANNAAGRVLRFGYASLVNVNASVTRGQYGKTHTVAKQAAASATRTIGTFCQFLTGGTTPTATLFPVDLLGTSLSNPMTTTGDIIYSSDNSGTPARLASTTSGYLLTAGGAGVAPAWAAPPSAGLLAVVNYIPASLQTFSTTSATFADVDATNLIITFTAPASGKILVAANVWVDGSASTLRGYLGLREASSDIGTPVMVARDAEGGYITNALFYLTGVSGGSHSYKLSFARGTTGTFRILVDTGAISGVHFAPAMLTVTAAP